MFKTRQFAALLSCIAAASMVGCNKPTSGDAASVTGGDIAATVNGEPITRHDFDVQLENFVPNAQTPQNVAVGKIVMERLISNLVIAEFAKKENIAPTDAEIDAEYANIKTQHDYTSVKPLETELSDAGMTPESYKESTIRPLLSQLKLLTQGMTVTDAEMRAYYDQHKTDEFMKPERAHIKRIAFTTQQQAQQIYDQIKSGTKSFEDFVPQSIIHDTNNGDINSWVPLGSPSPPTLEPLVKAILAVSVNQSTPPFKLQNVWWIVKLMEERPAETIPYDAAKSTINLAILNQKAQQDPAKMASVKTQVRDFQMHSTIVIPEANYADLIAEMMKPEAVPAPPAFSAPQSAPAPPAASAKP